MLIMLIRLLQEALFELPAGITPGSKPANMNALYEAMAKEAIALRPPSKWAIRIAPATSPTSDLAGPGI
jgi:hypothetical protein